MKKLLIIIFISIMAACKDNQQSAGTATAINQTDTIITSDVYNEQELIDTFYIVVADSSNDYYELNKKMYLLSSIMNYEIDTMGRYYNNEIDKIILPENDEDELYAGSYFLRRFGTSTLSIEYLSAYTDDTTYNTMILVAALFDNPSSADSLSQVLKNNQYPAFVIKAGIYTGCMH